MARKVRYHVSLDIVINESDLALLRFIEKRSHSSQGPISLAARTLASELQLSMATVRRSCHTLTSKGLIFVRDEHRADGGRDANAYEVTLLGFEVLRREGVMRPQRTQPAASKVPNVAPKHVSSKE